MAANKSPGGDGLPKEFSSNFWETIGPDMVEVFNNSLPSGEMTPFQREAVVTLLYKKISPMRD